jgi:hypothetical protein
VQKILTWRWKSMTQTEHRLYPNNDWKKYINVNKRCNHSFGSCSTNWKREVRKSLNVSGRSKVSFCVCSRPVKCSETQRTHYKLEYMVPLFLLFYLENHPITDTSLGKLGLKVSQATREGWGHCFRILQFCRFRSALEVCDSHNKSVPRGSWKAELLL